MSNRVWDSYLTEQDKAHLAMKEHRRIGFGERPSQNVTPSEARGLSSWEHSPDVIGHGVTIILNHKVLRAKDLDSSVPEFILSRAEGLLRNDMSRFEIDS